MDFHGPAYPPDCVLSDPDLRECLQRTVPHLGAQARTGASSAEGVPYLVTGRGGELCRLLVTECEAMYIFWRRFGRDGNKLQLLSQESSVWEREVYIFVLPFFECRPMIPTVQ